MLFSNPNLAQKFKKKKKDLWKIPVGLSSKGTKTLERLTRVLAPGPASPAHMAQGAVLTQLFHAPPPA
jgi:hypothetical protein